MDFSCRLKSLVALMILVTNLFHRASDQTYITCFYITLFKATILKTLANKSISFSYYLMNYDLVKTVLF